AFHFVRRVVHQADGLLASRKSLCFVVEKRCPALERISGALALSIELTKSSRRFQRAPFLTASGRLGPLLSLKRSAWAGIFRRCRLVRSHIDSPPRLCCKPGTNVNGATPAAPEICSVLHAFETARHLRGSPHTRPENARSRPVLTIGARCPAF